MPRVQVRHFHAGDWIVEQNARARHAAECYLILSGEAAVLMHAPASVLADPCTGLLHLCTRRAGNFVGALQLSADSGGSGSGSPSGQRGGCGTSPAFGGGCGGCLAASFSSDSMTLASMAWREDSWPSGAAGGRSGVAGAHGSSDGSSNELPAAAAHASAGLKLRVIFMVLRVAKRCGTSSAHIGSCCRCHPVK